MDILRPNGWMRPSGYSDGIAVDGTTIFVSGQVGWNHEQRFPSMDLVEQIDRTLQNTLTILRDAGATASDVVRMNWYFLDLDEYRQRTMEVGKVYQANMGKHYPAMTALQVVALMEPEAKVEIETLAIVCARHGAPERSNNDV